MAALNNPVDIIGDALSARYESALKILIEEKEADAIIVLLTPQMMTEAEATAKLLAEYNKKKLIIPVFLGGPAIEKSLVELKKDGLVNFTFLKDTIEALDNLACGALKKESQKVSSASVAKSSEKMMAFNDTRNLLKEYGLALSGILIKEKTKLIGAISKLGSGPYAMKVISVDIVHKTEAGVVCLNIKSIEEANSAWNLMEKKIKKENPGANIEGILVQKIGTGREIIIGMKRDTTFGPTILFGLGGILAEAIKDTSLRVAPVGKDEALKMMREIKGISILNGIRGEKPVNFDALAEIIVKSSRLSIDHPEIKEMDLNPIMVTNAEAEIVDARMMV